MHIPWPSPRPRLLSPGQRRQRFELILAELDNEMRQLSPAWADKLRPGATKAAIEARLGSIIDIDVPDDVRTWLSWHDGAVPIQPDQVTIGGTWHPLALEEIEHHHSELPTRIAEYDLEDRARGWLPLLSSGSALTLVDCSVSDGQSAPLIVMGHGESPHPVEWDLSDLAELILAAFRSDLFELGPSGSVHLTADMERRRSSIGIGALV